MLSSPIFLRIVPLVFTFLWSSGWIVAGYSAQYADPLTFLSVRFASAAVLLGALSWAVGAPWPATPRAWLNCIIAGVLLHALYLAGVWWAVANGVPSGVSGIMAGLQPMMTALLAPALLGERITLRQGAGVALGFLGIVAGAGAEAGRRSIRSRLRGHRSRRWR
jgi:drug/metabolite transporter (DMT)-like permease